MSDSGIEQLDNEAVLERIMRNQLTIKELEEENAELKDFYRDRLEAGDIKKFGKYFIRATTNSRIDDSLARAQLSKPLYASISSMSVDSKKARAMLSDADLKRITKTYANKIEVGLN